jgi:hypothetical protein
MAMFEMKPEQVAKWKNDLWEEAEPHIQGEELVAVAPFRRGGATASYAASKAGGGLPYLIINLFRKKQAGGLPQQVMLAVTPTKLHAFKWKQRGSKMVIGDEVAVWERAGLQVSTEMGGGMTKVTISSPAEGEKVTLVGASIKDDPVSQELIEVLKSGSTTPVAR